MTPATNTIASSPSLPTLAAIQRRRRELLAYQSGQRSAPATAPPHESLAEEEPSLEEDSCLDQEPEEPDHAEDSEPSPAPHRKLLDRPHWPTPPSTVLPVSPSVASRLTPKPAPAAILLQFLAPFGNLAGPAPHCLVGSTRHALNLFVVLVGESSKARKGTSWRQLSSLFTEVDGLWAAHRYHRPPHCQRHHPCSA